MAKKILKHAGNILTLLALCLICRRLVQMDIDFAYLFHGVKSLYLLLFVLLYTINMLLIAWPWRVIIEILEKKKIPFLSVQSVMCKANLMKYIPGNIFQYVGRNEIAALYHLDHKKIALSTVLDVLTGVLSNIILILLCYSSDVRRLLENKVIPVNYWYFVAIAVCFCLFFFFIIVRKKDVEKIVREYADRATVKKFFWCIIWNMFIAVYAAMIYFFILKLIVGQDILWGHGIRITGAYLLSWLVGFLMPGAPGGIGIRETVMVCLLGGSCGEDSILLSMVIFRFVNILGDFFAFVITGLCQYNRNRRR